MSLRAIPLTLVPFLLYCILVLFSGGDGSTDGATAAKAFLGGEIFGLNMMSGARWSFTWGDLLLIVTLVVLFVEILKATYTSTASLIDHGLSMLVFIVALIVFLMFQQAATSTFFLIMVALLIDVVAGFIIGIRVARRDIGLGTGDQ